MLIEPDHRDAELFFANTFSYRQRRKMAEHAYQQTRQMLRSSQSKLGRKLGYHGITLNHALLDDNKRHLCPPKHPPTRVGQALTKLHNIMDNLGHLVNVPTAQGQPTWS